MIKSNSYCFEITKGADVSLQDMGGGNMDLDEDSIAQATSGKPSFCEINVTLIAER